MNLFRKENLKEWSYKDYSFFLRKICIIFYEGKLTSC
nr:MAG TPA: hypothetical protein [Caudoviricetes sp.]